MSRIGVSLEQVRAVKIAIESRGELSSQEKVRQGLGNTGSHSTIAAHLRTLRAEEEQQSVRIKDIPAGLSDSVTDIIQKMWEQASRIASADVEYIRRKANSQIEVLQAQHQELIDAMKHIEDELDKSQSRVAECEAEIEGLKIVNADHESELMKRSQCEEIRVQMYREVLSKVTDYFDRRYKNTPV